MTMQDVKKVVITGGAGLVGSHIIDRMLGQNPVIAPEQVVVIDNYARGDTNNLDAYLNVRRLTILREDICNRQIVDEAIEGADYVFHQAAIRITRCAAEPRLAMEVLVDGTFNVIEAAARHKVKKVVAASSASVYGMADQFPTPETQNPYNNDTLYGAAKSFNEGMLHSFHAMQGLPYVALRYFNVYGPRMDIFGRYTEVFIRWKERIAKGEPPLIFGDGSQTMDFIFSEDIARANILAAVSDVKSGNYNIASGVESSLKDLAQALIRVMGASMEPEYGPERTVANVPRRLADVRRAQADFGFKASIGLEEGLRKLVAWWRAEKARAEAQAAE
jgi:UDP-glucose 4-epimerase